MLRVSTSRDSTEDARDGGGLDVVRRSHGSAVSLVLIFERGAPRALPAFQLDDLDAVTLGRAPADGADRAHSERGERRMVLQLADKRISQVHAHVRLTSEGWCLEDAGSKNGTRVNGFETARAILHHGDLIEVGLSFLLFTTEGRGEPARAGVPEGLATFNEPLARQLERLALIARAQSPVLVRGETGTGKELVARAIHQLSGRSGALRTVNCPALPRTLLESELFGYKKGSFSGAVQDRLGLVRSADQGTLFLDEIGDFPLEAQPALLRTLEQREVHPIGATAPVPVDFRVVAATHRDLLGMVQADRFRSDLFERLNGFSLTLPPLRERREDLGTLVSALVSRYKPAGAPPITLSPAAVRAIHAYPWPGNIRELAQAIGAALPLAGGDLIDLEHLPERVRGARWPVASADRRQEREPNAASGELEGLLVRHRGNVSAIAEEMRTSRMQVHRLCRRFGLDLQRFRSPTQ
jgi:DNA-binding NtrC family response regulator